MRLSYFVCIVILQVVSVVPGCGQSSTLDSLQKIAENSTGRNRVDALNAYAYALMSYDYIKSEAIANESFKLGSKLDYQKGIANALMCKGIIYFSLGNDSLAKITFRKTQSYFKNVDEKALRGRTLAWLGYIHQNLGDLDSASFFYNRSFELLKDSANPMHLSFLYLHQAEFYKIKNDPTSQLNYLTRSWEIRRRLKDKTSLVWIGVRLASYYAEHSNYKEAISYLDTIQSRLGKDTLDNEEINIIRKQRGIILTNLGEHKKALDLFAKVKRYYEKNPFPLDQINVLMDIGYAQAEVSNFETSLRYCFQALKLSEANSFKLKISIIYFRIGWVYYLMGQNSLSEQFAIKALKFSSENNQDFEEASALNLLGMLSDRGIKSEKALEYLTEALAIREKNNFQEGVASTLLNIGLHYEKVGQFDLAEAYELRSLSIEEKINHLIGMCYSYQSLGQLYLKIKKMEKASYFLEKGEVLAKRIKAEDAILDVYRNKRDLYTEQRNYQMALRYSLLFDHLRDSLFNKSLSNRIITLQHDYELDRLDKEIALLNKDRQLQQAKVSLQQREISQQRLVIIIVTGLLILVTAGSYMVFRFYRKVRNLNREISEQNEEITVQSEELREANEVLGKLNREISEQKEEIQAQAEELIESNQTIARINDDLEEKIIGRTAELRAAYQELDTFFYRSSHDFRRPLTTFMGLAEVAKVTVKDSMALDLFNKVNETAHSLDKMLVKLQSISLIGSQELIYSEVLMKEILQIELYQFRDEIQERQMDVKLDINLQHPFYSYPALIKIIIQNLIENAIAFSAPQHPLLKISVSNQDDLVVLTFEDNGQGIDELYLQRIFEMYFRANEKSKGNGLGLYIVKKIVDKLRGTVSVKSQFGKGTLITVTLPNQQPEY